MKYILWILCLSSLVRAEDIVLFVKEQKTLTLENIKRVAIANPEIADVLVSPEQDSVTFIGVAEGETQVSFTKKSKHMLHFNVKVLSFGDKIKQAVAVLIKDKKSIYLEGSKRLQLRGYLTDTRDYLAVRTIQRKYPQISSKIVLHQSILNYLLVQIRSVLIKHELSHLEARIKNSQIYVKGEVKNKDQIYEVESLIYAIYPESHIDLTHGLQSDDATLIDIKFLEVKKTRDTSVGLSWPTSFSLDGQYSLAGSASSLILSPNSPVNLNTLIHRGVAKVLSNPQLLCKTGTPASFLAGGEVPIRLVSERTASVTFKPYGINIEVSTKSDRSKNISLNIAVKISDIDASVNIDGLPGFIEHHIKTAVDLKLYQTVVLAGLFENRNKKSILKFPILGHVPVLGELFKSRSFQNNESEFYLTLTPKLPNKGTHDLLRSNMNANQLLEPSILD